MPPSKRNRSASPKIVKKRQRSRILRWNRDKPVGCSVKKWRRIQVMRFLGNNPDAKGMRVKDWLTKEHEIDPWPDVNIKQLNQNISRWRGLLTKEIGGIAEVEKVPSI